MELSVKLKGILTSNIQLLKSDFNVNQNVATREVQQVQVRHVYYEIFRERLTTGVGPPSSKDKVDKLADLLTVKIEDQQPLNGTR